MPLPRIAKAGRSIQNHQMRPAGAKKKQANETSRNPTPTNALLIPFARVGGPTRSKSLRCLLRDGSVGSRPVSAWCTRVRLLPHERQYTTRGGNSKERIRI